MSSQCASRQCNKTAQHLHISCGYDCGYDRSEHNTKVSRHYGTIVRIYFFRRRLSADFSSTLLCESCPTYNSRLWKAWSMHSSEAVGVSDRGRRAAHTLQDSNLSAMCVSKLCESWAFVHIIKARQFVAVNWYSCLFYLSSSFNSHWHSDCWQGMNMFTLNDRCYWYKFFSKLGVLSKIWRNTGPEFLQKLLLSSERYCWENDNYINCTTVLYFDLSGSLVLISSQSQDAEHKAVIPGFLSIERCYERPPPIPWVP